MVKYSVLTAIKNADFDRINIIRKNLIHQKNNQNIEWIIAFQTNKFDFKVDKEFPFKIKIIKDDFKSISAARNQLLDIAKGTKLIFLDADDLLTPGCLEKLESVPEKYQFVDLRQIVSYIPQKILVDKTKSEIFTDLILNKNKKTTYNLTVPIKKVGERKTSNYFVYSKSNRFKKIKEQLKLSGKVIDRKFLIQNKIRFQNDLYNSDLSFMAKVVDNAKRYVRLVEPSYIKIKHNDPIQDPSDSQINSGHRNLERIQEAERIIQSVKQKKLNKKISLFLFRRIIKSIKRGFTKFLPSEQAIIADYLANLSNALPSNAKRSLDGKETRFFKLFKTRRVKKMVRLIQRESFLRSLKKAIIKGHRPLKRFVYKYFLVKLPIQKRTILFESFLGRNYAGNPKYIYNYLHDHHKDDLKLIWIFDNPKDKERFFPKGVKIVKRFGWKYMYYLAVSKYQVFNMRQPKWFIKRKGTIFLETWHGTPLKRLVFDMDNVASSNPHYKQIFYKQSRQWDYLLAPNSFSSLVFARAFLFPEDKIITTGYPRNDRLCSQDQTASRKVLALKRRLGIPLNKKVILYAPTWRDDTFFQAGKYKFELNLNLKQLQQKLGKDYILLLRTHYFIANRFNTNKYKDFVFDFSKYDDINDLYLVSDMLVTDYSSVFFDYSITGKPILFYVYDYEKYESELRGFYLDMKTDVPGPLVKSTNQLITCIINIKEVEKKYYDKYRNFAHRFVSIEDGNSTERVCNQVFKSLK